ncbi:hypothetical protein [Desulfovibrio sp. ZJ746]|uniref:hypothetical protein n=1 Tax=Desulfovibrio sp. ZJ746 TaxID=2709795 RepID=UPI0013EC4F9E|nr:hypothetical protein [Desulfovibrio sp. ZJ746]
MDATLPLTQKFPRLLFFASVAVLLLLFGIECFLVLHTRAWRHDSFLYIPSYYGNLISEGRWLNYLLFPALRHFPPHLALALSFAAFGYFSWSVARQLTDRRGALLFALAALQLPSIYSLFGWPLIPLSAYLLLAAAAYLARRLDYRLFFLFFGILFHGTLNNFYNLLIVLSIAPLRRGDMRLAALLIWYAAGFVAGYAATQLIILAVHGSFMQVAEWRRLNYPVSIPDAIRNLRLALGSLKDNLMILPDKALVLGSVLFCMALSQWHTRATKRERERERACCCALSSPPPPMRSSFASGSMWRSAPPFPCIFRSSAFPCWWRGGTSAFSPWRSWSSPFRILSPISTRCATIRA